MDPNSHRIGQDMRMDRRTMLRRTAASLTASAALGGMASRSAFANRKLAQTKFAARDHFGGCPDIRFDATGYFRLENADRWWLVTPDGSAFLSLGVNHVIPNKLRTPYNEKYWFEKFGAKDNRDPAFMEGYQRKVRKDLDAFGFNTLGTHSPVKWYPTGFCPHVHSIHFVEICHWQVPTADDFLDVYSDEFAAHCDKKAKEEAEPYQNDPSLIGYSMSDCPIFTDLDAAPREPNVYGARRIGLPTWPRVLRNLNGQAAGKQAYVETMRKLYADDIAAFNETYGSSFDTFDALLQATNWRPDADPENFKEARDNRSFLDRTVHQYYQVTVSAIRKYDTNHMIFGDKLNGNTNGADVVLPIANKYMDLVYYQTFGFYDEQKPALDRWSKLTGKPLFNGDSSYSVPSATMPDPYGPQLESQVERSRTSLEFAERAFARPDFVGWNICGWIDDYSSNIPAGLKQHGGLQTPMGEYHQPLQTAMAAFSARMYDLASTGV